MTTFPRNEMMMTVTKEVKMVRKRFKSPGNRELGGNRGHTISFRVMRHLKSQIKQKRKGHKVFTNMVIQSYKKCIELLRKRQENFL